MIKSVKFVSIPVADQDRALKFYTTRLGFEVFTDQPISETQRWIELNIPGAQTKVVLFTPAGQEDRIGTFVSMAFSCDDVQRTYEQLSGVGVEFDGPPATQPWGSYALMKDPDGNTLCLSSA